MIIVTGSITAKPDGYDALLAASLAHVRRSRSEDGCISHAVRIDAEDPMKLVFFEEWRDLPALKAHFLTPGIRDLMAAIREHSLASEPVSAFEAHPVPV